MERDLAARGIKADTLGGSCVAAVMDKIQLCTDVAMWHAVGLGRISQGAWVVGEPL